MPTNKQRARKQESDRDETLVNFKQMDTREPQWLTQVELHTDYSSKKNAVACVIKKGAEETNGTPRGHSRAAIQSTEKLRHCIKGWLQ